MRLRSKRYRKDLAHQPKQVLPIDDAVKALKGYSKAKFDQSVDIVCHLGIDPRQADQMIRGSVSLPKGIGKSKKVIAFCPEPEIPKCKEAGAVEAGGDALVQKVADGWTDFDVAIAHPSLMGKVGKLGRVLGPQGKMPSPKSGTVTADIAGAVKEYAAGKVEFRNDSFGNVHAIVGKMSFGDDALAGNINAFIEHIRKLKPQTSKGVFMKKVVISGSMTPGVQLEVGGGAAAEE